MKNPKIIIVGAGVAGLACASKLKQVGLNPIVLDKGRNIGGRLATRRTVSGLQFDHGAQYMSAKTPEFQEVLNQAMAAGMIGEWDLGAGSRYVGMPSMNGFAEFLGKGIDVKQSVEVTSVEKGAHGYEIRLDDRAIQTDKSVVTVPAPQSIKLLGKEHILANELTHVEMLPCLTLMATLNKETALESLGERDEQAPLSWIALDSSKPDRNNSNCWVAHANPILSAKLLEEDKETIKAHMLPLLCDRLGVNQSNVIYAVAHRWRYAAVSKPLGRPFIKNDDCTLYLGGDWCLDARVEAAWLSGTAIANDILKDL